MEQPGADPTATETLLTAVFAAYASDVSTGRVRANRVDKDIDIQQRKVDKTDLLKAAASLSDFAAYPRSLPLRGRLPRRCRRRWRLAREARSKVGHTAIPDARH